MFIYSIYILYYMGLNEINTEARLTATSKVFQQGNGLGVLIPWSIKKNLGVEKGDLLEVTVRHTGIRNAIARKSNFPNSKTD